MAGRFVFQKLTSGIGMSRSTLASASSRATAPVNRAWEGGTKSGTVLPNSRGLHGRIGGGIGTLSNLFCGTAVRPGMVVPSNHEILRGCGARYLNTRTRRHVSKHKKSAIMEFFEVGKPSRKEVVEEGHYVDAGYLSQFSVACCVMSCGAIMLCSEDDNVSRKVPSKSLHRSGCNCQCHSRR